MGFESPGYLRRCFWRLKRRFKARKHLFLECLSWNINKIAWSDPKLRSHVGKKVTTFGWLVTGKTVHTKDGEPIKFVSFEDTTGLYETVFFPKEYNRFCHMLNGSRPYILEGRVEEDFGSISVTVSWIGFLDKYKREASHPPQSKREGNARGDIICRLAPIPLLKFSQFTFFQCPYGDSFPTLARYGVNMGDLRRYGVGNGEEA